MASRADEYRQRAQQCLEMAGTFRDHKARVALSHMAQVWLALADRHQDTPATTAASAPETQVKAFSGASSRRRAKPSGMKMSKGREGD